MPSSRASRRRRGRRKRTARNRARYQRRLDQEVRRLEAEAMGGHPFFELRGEWNKGLYCGAPGVGRVRYG